MAEPVILFESQKDRTSVMLTDAKGLILVTVAAIVVGEGIGIGVVGKVHFKRIESDDHQLRSALVAANGVALLGLGVDIDLFAAFRANDGWHESNPPKRYPLAFAPKAGENNRLFQTNANANAFARPR